MVISVGDFIAIYNLCNQTVDFLKDCGNAKLEYADSILVLQSLSRALRAVEQDLHDQDIWNADHTTTERQQAYQHALTAEFHQIRTALENGLKALQHGYGANRLRAGHHSLSFIGRWNQVAKNLRWPKTRSAFEKQLKRIEQCMSRAQLLLGSMHMRLDQEVLECIAAIKLDLNERALPVGLPGSGGTPEEHVRLEYGLGSFTYLLMNICSTSKQLHKFLNVMFEDVPGESRIYGGHYRLYCNSFQSPIQLTPYNFGTLVCSGASLSLAFIVGSWQKFVVKLCPRCSRRCEKKGEDAWRNCPCGLSYAITEAGEVDYEPIDGEWFGEDTSMYQWEHLSRKASSNPQHPEAERCRGRLNIEVTDDIFRDRAEQPDQEKQTKIVFPWKNEESYFRRMVVVYDPIFNFICRNVFCRCIIGMESPKSTASPFTFLAMAVCPHHAYSRSQADFDLVGNFQRDYSSDPYFEKFGGYREFLQMARWLSRTTAAFLFLSEDRLYPSDQIPQDFLRTASEDKKSAMIKYRLECFLHVQEQWTLYKKGSHEEAPELTTYMQDWMTEQAEELSTSFKNGKEENAEQEPYSPTLDMVPVLSKGTVTLEKVEDLEADPENQIHKKLVLSGLRLRV